MMTLFRKLRVFAVSGWRLILIIFHEILNWMAPKRKSVSEDIILITGGGRGIGRRLALNFAGHHPKHIILWGRTQATLSQTAKDVQEQGVNCAYMVCDVSSREQIYSMAKEVEAKFGQVTILVNNAGVVLASSILNSDTYDTELSLRTNTLSHFWTTRAFLPAMIKNNRGRIVAIDSMLGLTGLNGAADYCTSKFATAGFAEALRDELLSTGVSGVKMTTIFPYQVNNTMFSGVSTRFPKLFPVIEEDYLAQKIVNAVLTDRDKVIVPKLMYLVALFYRIAPVSAVAAIMKFTEVHKAMNQFHEYRHKAATHS